MKIITYEDIIKSPSLYVYLLDTSGENLVLLSTIAETSLPSSSHQVYSVCNEQVCSTLNDDVSIAYNMFCIASSDDYDFSDHLQNFDTFHDAVDEILDNANPKEISFCELSFRERVASDAWPSRYVFVRLVQTKPINPGSYVKLNATACNHTKMMYGDDSSPFLEWFDIVDTDRYYRIEDWAGTGGLTVEYTLAGLPTPIPEYYIEEFASPLKMSVKNN